MIFDSEARLPLDSKLVQTAPEVPLILVVSRAADRSSVEALRAAGAEIVVAAGGTEDERAADALAKLGALGIQSMLLEGGAAPGRAPSSMRTRWTRCASS